MARNLRLDISSDSGDAVRGLGRVASSLDHVAENSRKLADTFSRNAIQERLALNQVAAAVDNLGDEAAQAERKVRGLGRAVDDIDVDRGGGLSRLAGRLGAFGAKAGSAFGSGLASVLSTLATSGPVAVGVAALGVALGGLLSGAITSAILLGVGGGVLAGGLALAFKDPRVQQVLAGQQQTFTAGLQQRARKGQIFTPHGVEQTTTVSEGLLAKTARVFKQAAEPLVPNLVAALESVSGLLDRIGPKIGDLFKTMRPAIEPLTRFLTTFVESALPGIQAAAEASLPLFEKLAEHGPKLGAALGKFFEILAVAMPLAVTAFGDLLTAIEVLLPAIAFLLTGFLLFYSKLREGAIAAKEIIVDVFSAMIRNILTNLGYLINGAAAAFGWIPGIGPKLKEAASKFNEFAAAVNIALASIKDRDVAVRAKVTVTDNNGKRVSIGEGMTIPRVGGFAEGGPVPGPPGAPQLAVVHGGEFVLSREMLARSREHAMVMAGASGWGGGTTLQPIVLQINGHEIAKALVETAGNRIGGVARMLGVDTDIMEMGRTGHIQIPRNAIV